MAFLPSLAVLLVLIHLVLEVYRWQMVPAYALTALTFLGGTPSDSGWRNHLEAIEEIGSGPLAKLKEDACRLSL